MVDDSLERSIDAVLPGFGHIACSSGELHLRTDSGKRRRLCTKIKRLRRMNRQTRRMLRDEGHAWAFTSIYIIK